MGLASGLSVGARRDKIRPKLQSKIDESDIVQQSLLEARLDVSRLTGQSTAEVKVWLKRLVEHKSDRRPPPLLRGGSRDVIGGVPF